jgi:hypothetical protein
VNVYVNEFDMADGPPSRPSGGFRAHLQGVNLHDLIQVENLARSTGVFVVLSGDRVGYLHMLNGELIHAEAEGRSGEVAALEILSWHEGEFRNCERLLAQLPTVRVSLQALLLRLAKASDEARHGETSPMLSTGTRRKDNGARVGGPQDGALRAGTLHNGALSNGALSNNTLSNGTRAVTQRIPVATRATRLSTDGLSRAEVLLNDRGELLDGRGHAYDEFASEVAYAARLSELIGQSLGAGEARAVEVHGKNTELLIRWLPNANVLGLVRAAKGSDADPAATDPSAVDLAAVGLGALGPAVAGLAATGPVASNGSPSAEADAIEIDATPIDDDAFVDDESEPLI